METNELFSEHFRLYKEAIAEFDSGLKDSINLQVVQDEKLSLNEKIEAYYTELADKNFTKSFSICKKAFEKSFQPLKDQGATRTSNSASLTEFQELYMSCHEDYEKEASGPAKD